MARVTYTSIEQITNELDLYAKVFVGQDLNLSHVPAIAQNRWSWFLANWPTLRNSLYSAANGNNFLLSLIDDLNNEVATANLGNSANPFQSRSNVVKFGPIFAQILLGQLTLTPEENILKNQEIERVSSLDIESFQQMREFIRKYNLLQAQEIGLSDATVETLVGVAPASKKRNATIADLDALNNTHELLKFVDGIIFGLKQIKKRPPNLLTFANANIDPTSEIAISEAYLTYIPAPFEISLENMAQKYLGSSRRWYELATVNNLQPPFVDEVGTKLSLLAPASANNCVIPSSQKDNLFVGSKITIGSYRYKEEVRIVERIILNENETMVLFLSGLQDLSRFLSAEGAFVRVYAPHTTRNGNFVLVPQVESGVQKAVRPTPTRAELQRLEEAFLNFGIDIARDTRTGDFLFDATGNFKYSYGFPAVRQSVLNALKTVQGELPFHPNYGINVNIGNQFYGTTDEALLFGELLRDTLIRDTRFATIQINRISTTGTGISLGLLVTLKGYDEPIPLSFIS